MRYFSLEVHTLPISNCCEWGLRVLQPTFRLSGVIILWRSSHYWICCAKRRVSLLNNACWASRCLVSFQVNFVTRNAPLFNLPAVVTYRGCVHINLLRAVIRRLLLLAELLLMTTLTLYCVNSGLPTRSIICEFRSWRVHVWSLSLAWNFFNHHRVRDNRVPLLFVRSYVLRWNNLVELLNLRLVIKLPRKILNLQPILKYLVPYCSTARCYKISVHYFLGYLGPRAYYFS